MIWRTVLVTVETTIVCLFLLQALRALLASLSGVIHDAVIDQALTICVVDLRLPLITIAMLTPLLLRSFEPQIKPRSGAALLMMIKPIPLAAEQPALGLCVAMLLVGGAAFCIALLLWQEPRRLIAGTLAGLGEDQRLRVLIRLVGSGYLNPQRDHRMVAVEIGLDP